MPLGRVVASHMNSKHSLSQLCFNSCCHLCCNSLPYVCWVCNLQTVQLSKRDQTDKAAHEKWAEARSAELAAAAAAPKEQRIAALEQSLAQLEVALAQKAEVRDTEREASSGIPLDVFDLLNCSQRPAQGGNL